MEATCWKPQNLRHKTCSCTRSTTVPGRERFFESGDISVRGRWSKTTDPQRMRSSRAVRQIGFALHHNLTEGVLTPGSLCSFTCSQTLHQLSQGHPSTHQSPWRTSSGRRRGTRSSVSTPAPPLGIAGQARSIDRMASDELRQDILQHVLHQNQAQELLSQIIICSIENLFGGGALGPERQLLD